MPQRELPVPIGVLGGLGGSISESGIFVAFDPLKKAMIEEHLHNSPEVRVYLVPAGSRQNVIIAPR